MLDKLKINRLILGGPKNGEFAHWVGDIVELPGEHMYYRKKLTLDGAEVYVYIYQGIDVKQALQMLQEGYLDI